MRSKVADPRLSQFDARFHVPLDSDSFPGRLILLDLELAIVLLVHQELLRAFKMRASLSIHLRVGNFSP